MFTVPNILDFSFPDSNPNPNPIVNLLNENESGDAIIIPNIGLYFSSSNLCPE